jgi:hypothetical protein
MVSGNKSEKILRCGSRVFYSDRIFGGQFMVFLGLRDFSPEKSDGLRGLEGINLEKYFDLTAEFLAMLEYFVEKI